MTHKPEPMYHEQQPYDFSDATDDELDRLVRHGKPGAADELRRRNAAAALELYRNAAKRATAMLARLPSDLAATEADVLALRIAAREIDLAVARLGRYLGPD